MNSAATTGSNMFLIRKFQRSISRKLMCFVSQSLCLSFFKTSLPVVSVRQQNHYFNLLSTQNRIALLQQAYSSLQACLHQRISRRQHTQKSYDVDNRLRSIYQYSKMPRGSQDKLLYLELFSQYPSFFRELRDKNS